MPFKSKAEIGFLTHHPDKVGGKHALEEWFNSTPNIGALPQKVSKKKPKKKK